MTIRFADGKHALAECDRCGVRVPYKELKRQFYALHDTGLLMCPDCWDPDHPQLQQGKWPVNDPQALRNPRPDTGLTASRGFFGWNPVGGLGLSMDAQVGTVTITTS